MTTTTELTDEQHELVRKFPAKFTASIIDAIADELFDHSLIDGTILDPFAGVGGIHKLADRYPNLTTWGIDIEPEQAALHPRTMHGDSRHAYDLVNDLAGIPPIYVDAIVTSPAYGNRLADQYLGNPAERCQPCKAVGWKPRKAHEAGLPDRRDDAYPAAVMALPEEHRQKCSKCAGTGRSASKRQGYAIALGRTLTPGSGAALPWGVAYRELHEAVVADVSRLLRPGGWWLVNISSALGTDGYMPVMEWWVELLARYAKIEKLRAIETPRSRMGANGDRRVPVEHLIVAQAAP